MQIEKCAIFWEISHLRLRNVSIVCIILSSADIKCFIDVLLSVPVVLTGTHPKIEQDLNSTLGHWHLNPMDILRNVFTSRISSTFLLTAVRILFINPLKYC